MEEDEEVEMLMCPPSKDQLLAFTSKELSDFLRKKGFLVDQCRIIEANKVDGKMFMKLTRSDLLDLYPSDFSARKKFWDFLSELTSVNVPSAASSSPVSTISTVSPENSSFEEDIPLSQMSGKPKLKRTKPREFPAPGKKAKTILLGEDFRLPGLSVKTKRCIKENVQLDDATRRQLIRETVTCMIAYAGEARLTTAHFTETAKRLCRSVPVLCDEKPPSWPDEVEFQFWASTKSLLRKRYSNLKSSEKHAMKKEVSLSCDSEIDGLDGDETEEDLKKHGKELEKVLKKKPINWKAVEQLQRITFSSRWDTIAQITGVQAVEKVLTKYPFLECEKVLLWELELHVSRLKKQRCNFETFISRWENLLKCFITKNSNIAALEALQQIHEPFNSEPLLLTLPAGDEMESFLKKVPSKHPYLVLSQGSESSKDEAQVFLILEKDVLCECLPVSDETNVFASSLVSLLAVYYSFNLQYPDTWKYLFTLLEEHVLAISPKRKSYIFKQIENRLLKKLN